MKNNQGVCIFFHIVHSVCCQWFTYPYSRLRLECDVTRTETRFRPSAKRTSPFKSAGASVQSTTGSRGVCISGSNVGDTMFRGSMKSTGYPLHSPISTSLPLSCVTVCHHISTGLYQQLHRSTVTFSLLIICYMFRFNCHLHGADRYITKISLRWQFCRNM
jgi:hypothetical protein